MFNAVARVDPALARRLHDQPDFRPFTVAVVGGVAYGTQPVDLQRGATLDVRITSIDDQLSRALDDVLAELGSSAVHLGRTVFQVDALARSPSEHPSAVSAPATRLSEFWLHEQSAAVKPDVRTTVRFLTPTTFRHQGENVPLPLPSLLFARLRRAWNAIGVAEIDPLLGIRIADQCTITGYSLHTLQVPLAPRSIQSAFIGECEYEIARTDEEARRAAQLLLDFGFFAGIGYKTSMGLGAIAPVQRSVVRQRRGSPSAMPSATPR
ncbi:MAG: hypothetical protein ABS52_07830 [Gemmatimonadetes bacterium SCN 70-22]|nr:MAG: hypothetical protein ABS52_07830 [Gemmatimonadetes bacterium SCN 70-22]